MAETPLQALTPPWTPERRRILTGIAGGLVYTAAVYFAGLVLVAAGPAVPEGRLALALPWLMAPGLMVLFGVARVGNARFLGAAPMDGGAPDPGSTADIDRRCLTNTVEQFCVFAPAFVALALMVPDGALGVVPVLAVSFVIARAFFWAGYHRHPLSRAFGMSATIAPSVAAYVWALVLWIGG